MEEKEIKESKCDSKCGTKCCEFTKKHVVCILSIALIIMTISTIALAFCARERGFERGGRFEGRAPMMRDIGNRNGNNENGFEGGVNSNRQFKNRGQNNAVQENQVAPVAPVDTSVAPTVAQ